MAQMLPELNRAIDRAVAVLVQKRCYSEYGALKLIAEVCRMRIAQIEKSRKTD